MSVGSERCSRPRAGAWFALFCALTVSRLCFAEPPPTGATTGSPPPGVHVGTQPVAGDPSANPPSPPADQSTPAAAEATGRTGGGGAPGDRHAGPAGAGGDTAESEDSGGRTNHAYIFNAGLGPAPEQVRRETPREAVSGFLYAASRGEYDVAAHYLYLWNIPPPQQKERGPTLARQLADVVDRTVYFDLDTIPDDAEPEHGEQPRRQEDVLVGSVPVPGGKQGLRLNRVRDARTGHFIWVFSVSTVDSIDRLYELHGLPPLLERLPGWMRDRSVFGLRAWQWVGIALLGLLSWLLGIVVERVGTWAIGRAGRNTWKHVDALREVVTGPGRMLAALVFLLMTSRVLRLSMPAAETLERVMYVGIVYASVLGAIRLVTYAVEVIQDGSFGELDADSRQRTMATRVTAVRRIAVVLIVIVGIALVLVQFPGARSAGISLLGSAGVAGAILGFAAQKVFANLFAGILISLTQPVRIGDVVIVENEWGRVEEIGSTHVVVRVWDLRRLVLPVTYFLDKPFQNWTKKESEINGTVFLFTDYHVDVNGVRQELERILSDHPLWDGRYQKVVVHDLTDRGAVIRVTVSASDGSRLWDLRCDVREKLLTYLQQRPEQLPRWRVEPRASLSLEA